MPIIIFLSRKAIVTIAGFENAHLRVRNYLFSKVSSFDELNQAHLLQSSYKW